MRPGGIPCWLQHIQFIDNGKQLLDPMPAGMPLPNCVWSRQSKRIGQIGVA
jgi:hypothetical protein